MGARSIYTDYKLFHEFNFDDSSKRRNNFPISILLINGTLESKLHIMYIWICVSTTGPTASSMDCGG